ncbi:LysR substrate-binding domain-containing protein [Anaerofustis sp. NSJ-163]|uniref:LysR substrate-binding domain-containing protein n=1 Tax=Anaerofustis sp. NSJ-163 TaxID=2944391 RepID=UPI00209BE3F5|nr:LysR substrate-binding domain-containing protein [Anaerofustis sp. NSJ-163]MCO8194023.1 LysR substrate-binding domain-containing protein [Anaerofustis sp. NSJ-163]
MLDFRVDTFLEVCKCMNITKASKNLNITQPAVTQHIKYLEKSYGVKLFGYKSKKLYLTREGEVFLNYITTLKHDDLKLRNEISHIDNKSKFIIFGATLTVGEYLMPDKLDKYLKLYPNTNIKMIVGNTDKLLKYLNDGKIDFAIIEGYFPKSEYEYITILNENYVGVCSCLSDLKDKELFLEDLLDYRLIIREKGSGSRELIERYLESKSVLVSDFKNKMEINSIDIIKNFIKKNMGITFLYELAVEKELKSEEFCKLNIKDMKIDHEFSFIWRKNSQYRNYYNDIFDKLLKKE